jgi:prepilin-type N-terminal cleavage/methylation domain-containing protein
MTTYIKQAQSGRSMIEMLGVLAIVGILSAGGIAGYSMAMQSYKTSALTEKVNLIAQQARVLYNGIYTGIAPDKLIGAGMITDNNNPFGGTLAIAASGADEFTVTTDGNVPAEACIKLLRTDWGTTGVFTSVKGKGSAGTESMFCSDKSGEGCAAYVAPAKAADAITACNGGDAVITWTFK